VGEAAAVGLADLGPLQQAGGEDQKVLEVDPGAALLRRLEGAGVEAQELGEVAVGDAALADLGGARDRRLEGVAERGEGFRRAADAERFQFGQRRLRAGQGQPRQRLLQRLAFGIAVLQLLEAFARRLDRRRQRLGGI